MKLKNKYFYTLREDAKDEDSISGNLLVKAGFIKKTSAGVYMMLPLGLKVQNKIEAIIRKNMEEAGAQEVKMPSLIAEEYYEKSGRLENFGKSIFRLKDRGGKGMALGPTHEELFALAAKMMIRSYKNMPFNLYQFQTKFRDEPRARFGLIRVKEFVMKDAYSFDRDLEGLDSSYRKMFEAYKKSFDEMGIDYRIVKADTGVMGGLLSEEFQAITPIGEDTVVYCDHCGYTSNLEVAECTNKENKSEEAREIKEVYTPNAGKIADVCKYLDLPESKFVKTLIYTCDGQNVAVMLRGDHDLSETKLAKVLGAFEVALADQETVETLTHAKVGFAGPIHLECPIYVDLALKDMSNFIVGANKSDYHLINVNFKDFKYEKMADLRQINENDVCPKCGKPLSFTKGIEIGNTFKLGTKYSKALELTYLNEENKSEYVYMGSYGIGLGRTMAALVEQNHDEHGIIWPLSVAPFELAIITTNSKSFEQSEFANKLHNDLEKSGIDVLLDDRDERAGVKFNDMDLIGIPYQITIGKKYNDGLVEVKDRRTNEKTDVAIAGILDYIQKILP